MSEHQHPIASSKKSSHLKLVWPLQQQCSESTPKVHSYVLGFALLGFAWHVTAEGFTEQERLLAGTPDKPAGPNFMASFSAWIRRLRG